MTNIVNDDDEENAKLNGGKFNSRRDEKFLTQKAASMQVS